MKTLEKKYTVLGNKYFYASDTRSFIEIADTYFDTEEEAIVWLEEYSNWTDEQGFTEFIITPVYKRIL